MDDRIILGLTVSLFLSVYVTAAALAVTIGYLIKKGMLGEMIRTAPKGKTLVAFALLGAGVSLLRGNWAGLLASAGVLSVVPEPSTCASLLAGLACGGYFRFRRRRDR